MRERGRRTGHWQRGGQSQKPNRKLNGRVGNTEQHTTTAISVPRNAQRQIVSSTRFGRSSWRASKRYPPTKEGRATRREEVAHYTQQQHPATYDVEPDTIAAGYLAFLFFFFSFFDYYSSPFFFFFFFLFNCSRQPSNNNRAWERETEKWDTAL